MHQFPHVPPLALVSVAALKDADLLTKWEEHLLPLEQAGLVSLLSEQRQAPGDSREQERHLNQARVILLLLSANFFASSDCLTMMERALERAHEGTARVIPLLLRPVAWQESPLAKLAHWPPTGVPITEWSNHDTAWDACVQELRRLLGRRNSEALSPEPSGQHADPERDEMLGFLRQSYQDLLDQSLHGIARVELGFSTRPDLISNMTNLLYSFPDGGEQLLASGTPILKVFDRAVGKLLILGAPGAGKSTLLLDLAQKLVKRALADPTYPLPIILRLSSWAVGRPALADWMVDQLIHTYNVPPGLSKRWVTQGRLLPLFDGLDEMEEAARPACIAAINTAHLARLVVCSRRGEYEAATADHRLLMLQRAVIVQPLSEAQIKGYLSVAGPTFVGVQTAIQQEPAFRELATTPLMLSVLLLTYRDTPAQKILQQGTDLERQVWTDYVVRQMDEKGNRTRYPLGYTRDWLSWLAGQMRTHQQTIFSAEYLQDDWLAHDQQRTVLWLATRLPAIVLGGCVGVLVSLFMDVNVLIFLFQFGFLGGFVGFCLSPQVAAEPSGVRSQTIASTPATPAHVRNALVLGLSVAACYGFSLHQADPSTGDPGYFLISWLRDGCVLGLGSLFSGWAFQRLLDWTPKQRAPVLHKHRGWQGRLATWMKTIAPFHIWLAALMFGGGIGLSYGFNNGLNFVLNFVLSYGLNSALSYGQHYGLNSALSNGLNWQLHFGLIASAIVLLVRGIIADTVEPLRFAERIHWTWRDLFRPKHLRSSLIVACALFVYLGLIYWQRDGDFGLFKGLSIGLSAGLSYWILLGLYQGMKQEHLEDKDRQQFNQGIRRSLRNGLLLGLIGALVIGTIGTLGISVAELRFVQANGLSIDLSNGLILLFCGFVVMWALSGGLTVLRHYVIRWLLARHHTFPWRAQAFLDDATTRILLRPVSGGYSFIHRRLQDYFADAPVPPPQK